MKHSFIFSKEAFYGSDTPSRTTVVCINTLFAAFVFFFYGAWADFIPSENWQAICTVVSAALSAIVAIYMLYVAFVRGSLVLPKQGLLQLSIGALITPFISYFVFWAALAQGIPALFTRIAGADHTETATLQYERYNGKGGCIHRLKGSPLDRAFPSYLCAPPNMRVSQPQRIILSGKSSYFGFYVITLRSDL
jgi:hypothetical protein